MEAKGLDVRNENIKTMRTEFWRIATCEIIDLTVVRTLIVLKYKES